MSTIPRKKLAEVVMRYRLEPTINDFIVEGDTDLNFFTWFFESLNIKGVSFYKIETFEISGQELFSAGLQNNNRDRIIYLARKLSQDLKCDERVLTCAIDQDFDLPDADRENKFISFTDLHSLESYYFDEGVIRKFLRLVLGDRNTAVESTINQLLETLNALYLIRQVNIRLNWGMEWVPVMNSIKVGKGNLSFDREDFIFRYLNTNNRMSSKDEFCRILEELINITKLPSVKSIRGKDFFEILLILSKLAKTNLPTSLKNEDFIAKVLWGTLTIDDLLRFDQFKRLAKKYSAA